MFKIPLQVNPIIGIALCLIGYACAFNLVRLVRKGNKKRRK